MEGRGTSGRWVLLFPTVAAAPPPSPGASDDDVRSSPDRRRLSTLDDPLDLFLRPRWDGRDAPLRSTNAPGTPCRSRGGQGAKGAAGADFSGDASGDLDGGRARGLSGRRRSGRRRRGEPSDQLLRSRPRGPRPGRRSTRFTLSAGFRIGVGSAPRTAPSDTARELTGRAPPRLRVRRSPRSRRRVRRTCRARTKATFGGLRVSRVPPTGTGRPIESAITGLQIGIGIDVWRT